MMMKNDLELIFWNLRARSEIPANLQGQFSVSGQSFLQWAATTLKGLGEFQNKVLDHFLPLFLRKKCNFKTRDFSPLIKWDRAGVIWKSHFSIIDLNLCLWLIITRKYTIFFCWCEGSNYLPIYADRRLQESKLLKKKLAIMFLDNVMSVNFFYT